METIRKIRCAYQRDGKSIRQIARELHLSRNTVKKVLRGQATEFTYARTTQMLPKLDPYQDSLLARLTTDADERQCRVLMESFARCVGHSFRSQNVVALQLTVHRAPNLYAQPERSGTPPAVDIGKGDLS